MIGDLKGLKFFMSSVISLSKVENGKSYWNCICDCGKEMELSLRKLKYSKWPSCGCYSPALKDEAGKKYNRLLVLARAGNTAQGDGMWNCLCDCGDKVVVRGAALRNGNTKSCGCSLIKEDLRYGQGIYSKGKYVAGSGKTITKEYSVWSKMLERCYNENYQEKCPSYKGCTVSENFKNFQYFAEWCNNQRGFGNKGWELDKDILGNGKVYSEDTCCFIPKELNLLFMSTTPRKGNLPTGCTLRKNGKLQVRIKNENFTKYLGVFSSVEEAMKVYQKAKYEIFKEKAEKFKYCLDEKVYNGILKFIENEGLNISRKGMKTKGR